MRNIAVVLDNEDWDFILDSLNDRLENLTALHDGGFEDFTGEIAMCEYIIKAIENRIAD